MVKKTLHSGALFEEHGHVRALASVLATWFWSGKSPVAPGTAGTLAALPFAWVIQGQTGAFGLAVAGILCFGLGCWASAEHAKAIGTEDPGEVVIDEVAAVWLVLAVVPPELLWYGAGFALFRLFDIWKPWPIRRVERRFHGGFGIMVDDVFAALYAAVILTGLRAILGV